MNGRPLLPGWEGRHVILANERGSIESILLVCLRFLGVHYRFPWTECVLLL